MNFHKATLFLLLASTFLFSGCSDEKEVKVYRLAKDPSPSSNAPLTWEPPENWQEVPAQGMRQGSFIVKGGHGKELDISITFLSGKAGGELANVNRWREQISLPPWSEEEFRSGRKMIATTMGEAIATRFSNGEQMIAAAMLPQRSGTWFFKMTGDADLARSEMPAFERFVEKVRPKGS